MLCGSASSGHDLYVVMPSELFFDQYELSAAQLVRQPRRSYNSIERIHRRSLASSSAYRSLEKYDSKFRRNLTTGTLVPRCLLS
eukprot:1941733-Amphidinium_carterae.1